MAMVLWVTGFGFLALAVFGIVGELPTAPLTVAFFGLMLLALAELLKRIGPKR